MTAFLVVGGIGFFMLVLTWFIGELFDVGHDVAGFFGDHVPSLDVGQTHIDLGGHPDTTDVGPSPFSSRVIFAFMTAFGAGGAIGSLMGLGTLVNCAIGLGSGAILGGATFGIARLMWKQGGTSGVEVANIKGRSGRVTIGIPAGGAGQVSVLAGGGSMTLIARTRDGSALSEGTAVRIVDVQGDLLLVEPQADTPS